MPDSETYARRLVKGSAIVFTAFITSEIIGLFLRMFLARPLTTGEYGLFYTFVSLFSLIAIFRELGLGSTVVKYVPEHIVHKRFADVKSTIASALFIQSTFGLIISIIMFILSDRIVLALFGTTLSLPFRILSIWFFVETFRSFALYMSQGFQNMLAYSLINFSFILSILLLAMFFVGVLGLGLNGVAFAYLLASLLVGVLGIAFLVRKYQHVFREKATINWPIIKKLLMFAIPIVVGGIGGTIITNTDTVMISVFRSSAEAGIYQAAQPTARILWHLPTAIMAVFFPMVSELWARRKQKLLGHTLHFLTKFSFIIIVPVVLTFITFPEVVINLLFGTKFVAGAVVLQILTTCAAVSVLFDVFTCTLTGIGRPFTVTKVILLMAGINLIGNVVLIPVYGIEGAAAATFASFVAGLALMTFYASKFVKYTVPVVSLFKALIGGVLTLLLISGLKSILVLPLWPKVFAVMIPSLLFYGTWILAMRAITKSDLRLIAKVMPMPKWLVRLAGKIVRE